MTLSVSEPFTRMERAAAAIDGAFRGAGGPAVLAARLAEAVRLLCPTTALAAGLVRAGDGTSAAVLDADGRPRPDLAETLRAGWKDDAPGELAVGPQRLFVEPAVAGGRVHGALAVAAPGDGAAAAGPETRAALAVCARHLALAALDRESAALRERLAEETALAAIGELAGPVVHEFNNLLNTMLLQVAVMEQKVDAALLPDLQTIRRQGASVVTLVKQWQQCRRRPANAAQSVLEFNPLLAEVVAEARRQRGAAAAPLTLELTPGLPAVRGPAAEIRRLIAFLLNHALAVSGGGPVAVRTEAAGDAVVLRVDDSGPAVPAAALARLFEPLGEGRPGAIRLELAACRTLVRRLQGKLRAENRPDGGVAVVVELPAEGVKG